MLRRQDENNDGSIDFEEFRVRVRVRVKVEVRGEDTGVEGRVISTSSRT